MLLPESGRKLPKKASPEIELKAKGVTQTPPEWPEKLPKLPLLQVYQLLRWQEGAEEQYIRCALFHNNKKATPNDKLQNHQSQSKTTPSAYARLLLWNPSNQKRRDRSISSDPSTSHSLSWPQTPTSQTKYPSPPTASHTYPDTYPPPPSQSQTEPYYAPP